MRGFALARLLAAAMAGTMTVPATGRALARPGPAALQAGNAARAAASVSVTAAGTRRTAHPAATGEVRGRVLDAGGAVPLPAASVTIEGNGETRLARTALDGAFAFAGLAPGAYALVVARASYLPSRVGVVIAEGAAVVVDVQLTRAPVALAPLVVRAARETGTVRGADPSAPDATWTFARRSAVLFDPRASPGGALASLVGVAAGRRPGEPGGGDRGRTLYIWGAREAGARVTVDGIPLGAPLHVGGLVAMTDDALVMPGQLWSGGAPARHDGGTDYLLELRTSGASDSLRGWGSADMLGERVGGELPLGTRGSVMAGARRVRDDALARWARSEPGYDYRDGLARLQLVTAAGGLLRATVLASDEALRIPRDQGADAARWSNRGGAVAWERALPAGGGGTTIRATASQGRIELPLLTLPEGFVRAESRRVNVLAEQRWLHGRGATAAGVDAERLEVLRVVGGDSLGDGIPSSGATDACPTLASCAALASRASVSGLTAALFVDHRRELAPWLQLAAGARAVALPARDGSTRTRLLPRLSLELSPSPATLVRLAAGRYSRLASGFEGGLSTTPSTSVAVEGAARPDARWMTHATATHVELGGSHRWRQSLVGVVGWWQGPGALDPGVLGSDARGVDVTWQRSVGGSSLSASYSVVSRRPLGWGADSSADASLRRRLEQVAALALSARLGPVTGALGASYAHGLSFASVVLDRNAAVLEQSPPTGLTTPAASPAVPSQRSFLRVDATVGGRVCADGARCRVVVTPYVRLLNALDRRDAIFYLSDTPARGARGLGWTGALLSVGARVDLGRPR